MDRKAFETQLKRDGYDEILTGTTQGPKHNAEHSHPYDVKAMVMQAKEDIGSGKRHPFEGPVVDQSGKTRVPAGQNISDEALSKMDYYVEGVSGKLPKS